MKQLLIIILSTMISTALFSNTALGHGGSHHPISPQKAQVVAVKLANQFTTLDPGLGFGKLPQSWLDLPITQASIHASSQGYYIIKLNNNAEKKNLYVLMAVSGEVYDANFSGEFKGLK